ncbi:MAG: hypothetical protein NWF00_06645 [Candidatus Bathyarchaeota archaeon]|nr:hypothetical protein [Candidatus Bathyarchaeota archaeon]
MHSSLLSDHERKLIKRYLETGERLEGFKVVLHRARARTVNRQKVTEDLKLLEKLLQKAGETP